VQDPDPVFSEVGSSPQLSGSAIPVHRTMSAFKNIDSRYLTNFVLHLYHCFGSGLEMDLDFFVGSSSKIWSLNQTSGNVSDIQKSRTRSGHGGPDLEV
jgi:hypothetical protein